MLASLVSGIRRNAFRRLTSNGFTSRGADLTTRLQLQGHSTLGSGLPAQSSGSTSLEVVTTRRIVERVGILSRDEGRKGHESEIDDRAHG